MRTGETVWRALAIARTRLAREHGLPLAGPVGEGWSRRRVIAALAAGTGAAMLPAAAPSRQPGRTPGRVAIIGGGIAGLTALHHLRAAGVDARLYEARKRLGGRMHTVTHADGTRFDRGAQLVNTEHADMHALARAYGVALVDRKGGAHETRVLVNGRVIPQGALADAMRGIAGQIDRDAARLDRDYAGVLREIDRLSIADYLDRHAALIPAPWVRRLLEQTSRTEYGAEPDRVSAIGLLFNLPVVDGGRCEVLGGADERYLIEGGSSTLIHAIAAAHADRIETARVLTRIERAGATLRLHFYGSDPVEADRVILAIPAPIVRQVDMTAVPMPPVWRAFCAQMEAGRNEKVQVAFPAAPWRPEIGHGGEVWHTDGRDPVASGWEGTVAGTDGPPVWNFFFGGHAPGWDNLFAADRLARDIDGALPGMAASTIGTVDRTAWSSDPFSMGAYVNYPPGQLSRFGHLLWLEETPGAARSTAGTDSLIFAGEHLSDAYPGYMNGGAQTGRLAAAAILGKPIRAEAA